MVSQYRGASQGAGPKVFEHPRRLDDVLGVTITNEIPGNHREMRFERGGSLQGRDEIVAIDVRPDVQVADLK